VLVNLLHSFILVKIAFNAHLPSCKVPPLLECGSSVVPAVLRLQQWAAPINNILNCCQTLLLHAITFPSLSEVELTLPAGCMSLAAHQSLKRALTETHQGRVTAALPE